MCFLEKNAKKIAKTCIFLPFARKFLPFENDF